MSWCLVSAVIAVGGAYGAFRFGRSAGVDAERDRCLSICLVITHETQKLSPSLRRAQHAIMNGLDRPLSEDEFFGRQRKEAVK